MEIKELLKKGREWSKRYRYVLLVLMIGMVLMLWPEKTESKEMTDVPISTVPQTDFWANSEYLEKLLSEIQGCGRVKVLLTYSAGERKVFLRDEHTVHSEENSTTEVETVIVTDGNKVEEGLVTQVCGPEYLGAVVVCQGGDHPQVRLAVSDAVEKATGLGSDRISVLKMK